MQIKVCGLREPENTALILALKPDYVGHIFYGPSPRNMPEEFESPATGQTRTVGVFVNASAQTISQKIEKYNLDIVQLHGNESPAFCAEIQKSKPVFKAFGIEQESDFENCKAYEESCRAFLFDTKTSGHGGSGRKFQWDILKNYTGEKGFFLSGGIGPEDVEAIQKIEHPKLMGIDINSGFEERPGLKNELLVGRFIKEMRNEN